MDHAQREEIVLTSSVRCKGRLLHKNFPEHYPRDEPYFVTAAWDELREIDSLDAVNIARELLKRAEARNAHDNAVADRREYEA